MKDFTGVLGELATIADALGTNRKMTAPSAGAGTVGTYLDPATLNDFFMNLLNAVVLSGQTLTAADYTQLAKAIPLLAAAGTGSIAADTGVLSNAYVIAPTPAIAAYAAGQYIRFQAGAGHGNTGASTIAVSGLVAKNIKRKNGDALVLGNIRANGVYEIIYDGTQFQLMNPSPGYTTVEISGLLDSAVNPPGHGLIGNYSMSLDFALTESVGGTISLPADLDRGQDIGLRLRYCASSVPFAGDNVKFRFAYACLGTGENITGASTANIDHEWDISAETGANLPLRERAAWAIPSAAFAGSESWIGFELSRIAASASDYAGDVRVFGLEFYYLPKG